VTRPTTTWSDTIHRSRLVDPVAPDSRQSALSSDRLGSTAIAPPDAPAQLRRALGLPEVTATGVGIIIGAGIYVLLGAATAEAGATVWLAFLLAVTLAMLTGLSYAELSSMFPRAG
jgi:amino acid permease